MTEGELRRLTPAEREALPRDVVMGAILTTREEARDILTIEGWEFVGLDDRLRDEDGYDPETDVSEVWRRQVGGRVEWCEVCYFGIGMPEVPAERSWARTMYPCDPRSIED